MGGKRLADKDHGSSLELSLACRLQLRLAPTIAEFDGEAHLPQAQKESVFEQGARRGPASTNCDVTESVI